MTNQVTITLNDDVYRRIERLAQLTGQPVELVIADTVEQTIPHIELTPISELNNAEVLEVANLQLDKKTNRRINVLLEHQAEGLLTETERIELNQLMQIYKIALVRKSQGLREAVGRGLMPPLEY